MTRHAALYVRPPGKPRARTGNPHRVAILAYLADRGRHRLPSPAIAEIAAHAGLNVEATRNYLRALIASGKVRLCYRLAVRVRS